MRNPTKAFYLIVYCSIWLCIFAICSVYMISLQFHEWYTSRNDFLRNSLVCYILRTSIIILKHDLHIHSNNLDSNKLAIYQLILTRLLLPLLIIYHYSPYKFRSAKYSCFVFNISAFVQYSSLWFKTAFNTFYCFFMLSTLFNLFF